MILILIVTLSIFVTCSGQSRHCIDDFDLIERPNTFPTDPRGHQVYEYKIPHAEEPGYWTKQDTDAAMRLSTVAWARSFYIFGKFADQPGNGGDETTTITAGIYRRNELIYKTIINCEEGTYENWVLNPANKLERLHHGDIDKSLTSCNAGDDFDLILKNDNFHLANWIFNAQPLQHTVRKFSKALKRYVVRHGQVGPVMRENIRRPIKVNSKYSIYDATKLRLEATGRAFFNRIAFGQCNAWPKGMESQCQKVREWIQHRSKANITQHTLDWLKVTPDAGFSNGLGVFGNNNIAFLPLCVTNKYFSWIQPTLHSDRNVPLYDLDKNGNKISMEKLDRAYCCCTDMKTGQVFNDDREKNCVFLEVCNNDNLSCIHAYDPQIGMEIEKELAEH